VNHDGFDQFQSSADYVTSEPLRNAVNCTPETNETVVAKHRPVTIITNTTVFNLPAF